jgi:hypothetical protein
MGWRPVVSTGSTTFSGVPDGWRGKSREGRHIDGLTVEPYIDYEEKVVACAERSRNVETTRRRTEENAGNQYRK